MQSIKWSILFLFAAGFIAGKSYAISLIDTESIHDRYAVQLTDTEMSPGLDSLISLFLKSTGDLTETGCHNSYDKKNFFRLPAFLRDTHSRFSPVCRKTFFRQGFLFTGYDPTDYYVYTLQKMII